MLFYHSGKSGISEAVFWKIHLGKTIRKKEKMIAGDVLGDPC